MRALVTGATSGIGFATAVRLARDAARDGGGIAVVHRPTTDPAQIVAAIERAGARAVAVAGDLADDGTPAAVVREAATALGGLDAVIANAGIMRGGRLTTMPDADYDEIFAVNTRATWKLAQAAFAPLAESRGAFVATASIAGSHPVGPLGAYSASKAALLALVRTLAYDWGPAGVRANCVSPGMILTPLSPAAGDPVLRAEREARIPLRRMGTPEDVAEAVAFLVGPGAAYITGVDLLVDGGLQNILMPLATGLAERD